MHSFDWQGQVVWGLTAAIMIEVAKLALGRAPDFEVDHPSNSSSSRSRGKQNAGGEDGRGGGTTAAAAGDPQPQPRM